MIARWSLTSSGAPRNPKSPIKPPTNPATTAPPTFEQTVMSAHTLKLLMLSLAGMLEDSLTTKAQPRGDCNTKQPRRSSLRDPDVVYRGFSLTHLTRLCRKPAVLPRRDKQSAPD